MGIRYYAYPIKSDDYEAAVIDPCPFHSEDPLADAWGSESDRPEMLYLDKCWGPLQELLRGPDGSRPRPAYSLVAGNVAMAGMGWIPHEKALSADEVREIADDLETIAETEIATLQGGESRWWPGDSLGQEFRCVSDYLAQAKAFTRTLADRGLGLVYVIG